MSRWKAFVRLATASAVVLATLAAPLDLRAADRPTAIYGHSESTAGGKGRDYGPIEKLLAGSSRFDWKVVRYPTADALYEAFRKNEVDVATVGPLLYVQAHHETGAIPVVAEGPSYHSVIIVRTDSPIHSLAELAGKSFAFGYSESTSSYLFPLLLLSRAGVQESDLGPHEFVGSHGKVVEAVLAGKFEAGGCIEGAAQPYLGKQLRTLTVSPPIPGVPVIVHPDADPALAKDLKDLLLPFRAQGQRVPYATGAVVVRDADYNEVRFVSKIVLGQDWR